MRMLVLILAAGSTVMAAPGSPASTPSSIVDLFRDSNHGILVGGWNGRGWVKDEAWHSRVKKGQKLRFFGPTGPAGEATIANIELSPASGSAWQIEVGKAPNSSEDSTGITGGWNAATRAAKELKADSAMLTSAVAGILRQKGLGNQKVNITRALAVDLDGDGVEEAVIAATHPRLLGTSGEALMHPKRTDYSFVAIRHSRGGKFVTTILEGDFKPPAEATPNVYELGRPLDLNGDGRMEIVVRWRYYEGGGTDIYDYRNGRAKKVLAASDGA